MWDRFPSALSVNALTQISPPSPSLPTPFCDVNVLGQPCLDSSCQTRSRVFSLNLAPAMS